MTAQKSSSKSATKSQPKPANKSAAKPVQVAPQTTVASVQEPSAAQTAESSAAPNIVQALLANPDMSTKLTKLAYETGVLPDRRQDERRHDGDNAMQFAVTQLTTPAASAAASTETALAPFTAPPSEPQASAPLTAPTAAPASVPTAATAEMNPTQLAQFQAAMLALGQQFGMPAEVIQNLSNPSTLLATTPRSAKDTRNSITRPGADTKTGKVWAIGDAISMQKGGTPETTPASIAELKAHPDLRQFNDHTIRTQYARWRQYYGVSGRVQSEMVSAPATKPTQKAFPKMTDDDFARYMDLRSRGQLDEGYKEWLDFEEYRRNPAAGNAAAGQAQAPKQFAPTEAPIGPMADEVYNRLLLLKNNNTLPINFQAAFDAETARRASAA
jgi:hypothetical protein